MGSEMCIRDSRETYGKRAHVHLVLRRVELVYQYLALVELMPGVAVPIGNDNAALLERGLFPGRSRFRRPQGSHDGNACRHHQSPPHVCGFHGIVPCSGNVFRLDEAPLCTRPVSGIHRYRRPRGLNRRAVRRQGAGSQAGTQVNVELMLDSSGSMADETNTGETRIAAAKSVLTDVIAALPSDRPEINVGFRVFGHKGNNTQAGKQESCQSSDLTVPIQGVDKQAL